MKTLQVFFVILLVVGLSVSFVWGGATLCNLVLLEFLGPAAPQPSVLAWGVLWGALFLVSNFRIKLP
jgi:hypothetical protein